MVNKCHVLRYLATIYFTQMFYGNMLFLDKHWGCWCIDSRCVGVDFMYKVGSGGGGYTSMSAAVDVGRKATELHFRHRVDSEPFIRRKK